MAVAFQGISGEDSVPRITPLQAAKQRLQWSKTLHERLGVDCYYCEDYYVVANVGRLVCAIETEDQRRVRLLRESYEAGALPVPSPMSTSSTTQPRIRII